MNALTFHGKETIRHVSVDDPAIEAPGDVIVRVEMAGICGSDLHLYHEREFGIDQGTVMGHEFVGEIVEVDKGVANFKSGDRVFSPFTTNCGQCYYCRSGLTRRCTSGQLYGWVENGHGLHGAQAEFVRVPLADSTLLKIPDGVSPEEGLLLGDIFSTGFFCAEQAGVTPAGTYVVVGCGPVGLMAIVGARELGAEHLYALDSVAERLELAGEFGATPIDYVRADPLAVVREATDGRGADGVLEVVGSAAATRLAMELLRPGGVLSSVGVHTEDDFGFSAVQAYNKNLTYKSGRCPARHTMERLVPVVQAKRHDLTAVISHRLPLSEGVRGYEIFDKKLAGCTKVVLEP